MIARNLISPISQQIRPLTMTGTVMVFGVVAVMVVVLAPREAEP